MNIVGDLGGGKMGNMNEVQAATWIEGKDSRKYNTILKQKAKSCANSLLATGDGPGGGSTRYTFDGTPTHHLSHGAGNTGGVTIVFVKRPGNTAKIVGIGYHIGAQTYQLTWTHHDWSAMRNVNQMTLD